MRAVLRFPDADELVLSATDLASFLACEHLSQEQLRAALDLRGKLPRDESPHGDLVRERGDRYEAEQLARLSARAGGHEEIALPAYGYGRPELEAAAHRTEAHMRAGVPLVYQAAFFDGRWQGRVDFLRRVEQPSRLGDHAYEVVDTKLARSVKPQVVHQLSLYARLVARVQGDAVHHAFVLLGDGTEERVDLRRYAALHRHVVRRLEALVRAQPRDVYPEPVDHCPLCRLERECDRRRRADDHLSFVARSRRSQREALTSAGVSTLTALATLPAGATVDGLASERVETLRTQAALQCESGRRDAPMHRHLPAERERGYARLPAPSPGDVFFDFEGDPYVGASGIEYLWGWTTADGVYHCLWAHDEAQERTALERFVAWVEERRAEHPGLHVFHYGAHERSKLASLAQAHGTGEEEIDRWLRAGVLVDLYAVVGQAMQVGEESYSLKALERHYGFRREEHSVRDGGGSIVAYETWLETRDDGVLEAIRRYNREDCLSTAALIRWLREDLRPEAAAELGADFDALAKPEPGDPKEPGFMTELRPVLEALRAGDDSERRLLADLLLYHYREVKPQWWQWHRLEEMTPEELVDERDALGLVKLDLSAEPVPRKQSLLWTYRFPPQETRFETGKDAYEPSTKRTVKIAELDDERILIGRDKDEPAHEVRALIPADPLGGKELREAATEVARAVLATPGRFPAVRALLRGERPDVDLTAVGPDVDRLTSAALSLRGSYLPIQGPPGSGKTYRAAHMVVAALRANKRVAVTATSHAAIQNFLRAIEARAREDGVVEWRGVYKGDGYDSTHGLVKSVKSNKQTYGDFDLIAGTAWLMSCERHREQFDLLFVDEAGQFALASAVAAGTVARSIVLLGDPQQLPQVNQASHPHGADASALGHLLGEHDVIPPDRGVFLPESFRMHPDVCAFVSELSYEGELRSMPACAGRRVDASGRLSGAGLRAVAVEHEGCGQESVAEAEAIAELCRELLAGGATVTDERGDTRSLVAHDVLVVAPYNLARRCIKARVPLGVRVGTVDKFQGQEAPVVFFALTCSSGEDVPRGLGFLFDRNRFNVAISRAQCLAVLVHAPRLLDADARSLEHMRLLDGLCRFVEVAEPVLAGRGAAATLPG